MRKLLSTLLIAFGIFCYSLTAYSIYERTNPQRISFAYEAEKGDKPIQKHRNYPIQVQIVDLEISLPIIPAEIENGKWDATTQGVSYLTSSPLPGEKGNSILYGHNWANLLGKLPEVKPGQIIEITYVDGSKKQFEIAYTVTVTPDQTHILAPSEDKRITLYTCTGFLDTKRFVAVGILQENNLTAKQ